MMRSFPAMAAQYVESVLFVIRGADMTLTTDQLFTKIFPGTNYIISNIVGIRKTGAFGVACLGGCYTGAGKTGDAILAAAQSWAGLTVANAANMAALGNILQTKAQSATPVLSLTTGNTGALTADIFIIGFTVD